MNTNQQTDNPAAVCAIKLASYFTESSIIVSLLEADP